LMSALLPSVRKTTLSSVATLSSSFPGMIMKLATAVVWGPYGSHLLQ
jgi:hypothetical protein